MLFHSLILVFLTHHHRLNDDDDDSGIQNIIVGAEAEVGSSGVMWNEASMEVSREDWKRVLHSLLSISHSQLSMCSFVQIMTRPGEQEDTAINTQNLRLDDDDDDSDVQNIIGGTEVSSSINHISLQI